MPRPQLTPGKDPVPIVQEAGWASGPVWTGVENLTPTGIRFPDFMTTAHDGDKVVSLTHRPPLPPGNTPGTYFC